VQIENALECYNLIADEEEYPCNINIVESQGYYEVNGYELETPDIMKPLKTRKV